jgi:hypothetical protein
MKHLSSLAASASLAELDEGENLNIFKVSSVLHAAILTGGTTLVPQTTHPFRRVQIIKMRSDATIATRIVAKERRSRLILWIELNSQVIMALRQSHW